MENREIQTSLTVSTTSIKDTQTEQLILNQNAQTYTSLDQNNDEIEKLTQQTMTNHIDLCDTGIMTATENSQVK